MGSHILQRMSDASWMITAAKIQFGSSLIHSEEFKENPARYIKTFCKGHQADLRKVAERLQEKYLEDDEELVNLAAQIKYTQAYLRLAACYGEQIGIMTEAIEFQQTAMQYMGIAKAQIQALDCL